MDDRTKEDFTTHDIFILNPIELVDYTHKLVKITLKTSDVLEGIVYTIDPVSQSVVLVIKEIDKTPSLKIVLKHSIQSIEKISDIKKEDVMLLENMFKAEIAMISVSENHKEKVKKWLEKNLIPVLESKKILNVDSVEIHPPYGPEQCFSSNSIVLSRIQSLLKNMPHGNTLQHNNV